MKPELLASIVFLCLAGTMALAAGPQPILPGQPIDNGNPDDPRACYGESIEVELYNSISPSIRSLLEIRSPYESEKWAFTDRLSGWSIQATDKKGLDAKKCMAEPIRAVALRRHIGKGVNSAITFINPGLIVNSILLEARHPSEPRFRSREYWMGQVSPEMVVKPDDLGFTLSIPQTSENAPNFIAPPEVTTPLGDPLVFTSCGFGPFFTCQVNYNLTDSLSLMYRFSPEIVSESLWVEMDSALRDYLLEIVLE